MALLPWNTAAPLRPLSASRLARFRKSEVLFFEADDDEDSAAETLGLAAHALVLEGREAFDGRYAAVGPINPKTERPYGLDTLAVAQWEAERGLKVIGQDVADKIEAIDASVSAHSIAMKLLRASEKEREISAQYCGIACHGRLDLLADSFLADFKTCADLDTFESDARRFGYVYQMAFYRIMATIKKGCKPFDMEVFLIAVEKKRPFRCGVWRVGQGALALAQEENEEAIHRLKECHRLNRWRTGFEEIRELDWL